MTRVQFFGHHEESNESFLYVIVASEKEEEDYENEMPDTFCVHRDLCAVGATVWKLRKFTLAIFPQKLREINDFISS